LLESILTTVMKFVYAILIFFFSGGIVMSQTEGQVNYEEVLVVLTNDIPNGQHRTLRDLISLLDHSQISGQIRQVLKDHTFFTDKEIDVLEANKAELFSFYYNNTGRIKYSEILNAFFITPIERSEVSFELKHNEKNQSDQTDGILRRLLTNLNSTLESKKYTRAGKLVNEIIELKLSDQEVYLNILKDSRLLDIPEISRNIIYQSLISALDTYPDLEIVEIALQMLAGGYLEEPYITQFLTTITNNIPDLGDRFESAPEYFQNLADSLGSLEEIRNFGYERYFSSRKSFFQFPVDYYGKLLALSDPYPWIKKNVIVDLQKSQHPRAFFYIAADLYKNLKENPNFKRDAHLALLESMTNIKVGIKGKDNKITFDPKQDEVAMTNYFLFWATHYEDFEWDENRQIFTNKLETLAKTQDYERLFRRLNSRNDTIALESFAQLTEGEPLEIESLAKKYRQLLRNQNKSLPSLKYQYLEQLSLLMAYCRTNKVSYKVKPALAEKLQSLLAAKNPSTRYMIENEIIEKMEVDEITAFEYWACLKEGEKNVSFSAGRILDWVYSKNWDAIMKDKDQVRLFLKKSYLFENIGVSGICNSYLHKFTPHNTAEYQIIKEISTIESDEDILTQLSLLLTIDDDKNQQTYNNIDNFLEDPIVFNRRDIKILPDPSDYDVRSIVDIIKAEEEQEAIKKLFSYLWLHPNIKYIPYLFELIDDDRIVTQKENLRVSVADNIIPIVEAVYNHNFETSPQKPFATEQWRELWKKDSVNFKTWEQQFFEKKLDSLQYFETLKIDKLNELTASVFYAEKHKSIILDNLKKVKPFRDLRKLSTEPKLSVEEDLKYFKDFFFTYKELDDIPKLFDITEHNIDRILVFIADKSATFESSERGSLYNNLFRTPWLSRYVNQGKLETASAKIIETALITYLENSEFLSEFEDQMTQLNIAQLQFMGKSIRGKIDATLALDADKGSKAKILKAIIATISYNEIGLVVSRFDEMVDILGDKTYAFLSQDFGIPVFSFETTKEQELFILNHKEMSIAEFYTYYLKEFGLDLSSKKGTLDYQKIYNILRFDIVSPFAGETGGKRDLYIFGLLKLLEIQFNTQLGFHDKLNESQTFYSFSSIKRAQAWLKYLEGKKLINTEGLFPPSFNLVREEN
jgi:hypothetical protein